MDPIKKRTAQAIVNVFETGSPRGDYGNVTLLKGDTGHLTYGRSQTTLASGNLYKLVRQYCQSDHAQFGERLEAYLDRLKARDVTLDDDERFKRLLRLAGQTDPVMQEVQDSFFDAVYWQPANDRAYALGIATPLGVAVVYDSTVHGSFPVLRDRTTEKVGSLRQLGERGWIGAYVRTRRSWLANHTNALLHKTVYRMDTFQKLIDAGNWDLDLPLVAHGVTIDIEDVG